jgi:acetolactate synthase-1/2/3 large subunit
VLTTYKAKGALDEGHPLWAGILTGGDSERPLLAAADAVLAVGLDPVELLSRPWPYAAAVHALRTAPSDHPYPPGAATAEVGDLGAAVRALAGRLDAAGRAAWTAEEVARHREGWLGRLRIPGAGGLRGWQIVETVQAQAPEDTIAAVDAGAHMFPATSFWRSRAPGRFLISNGLATMGFAVPAAIGAALARPESPVIALTGDGGMAYHAAELETARRAGARVIVVVFNDASLSLIRIKHEANGHARAPLDLGDVRFDQWAAALGAHGARAATAHELAAAVRGALARPASTVIDVRMDGDEYAETLEVLRG